MLHACIDIGSNTTRVLVADVSDGRLSPVLMRKVFTRIGRNVKINGRLSAAKIDEVAAVVETQVGAAVEAGARSIRTVATHAVRCAPNRDTLCAAVRDRAGVDVEVLGEREEARLAFLGATRTCPEHVRAGARVAVVDLGGGSTEIAVGRCGEEPEWSASFPIGSGFLCDAYVRCDPPASGELSDMARHARDVFGGLEVPDVDVAVAVGGSAAAVGAMVQGDIDPEALRSALSIVGSGSCSEIGERYGLEAERVRLLPAGILVLDAVATTLGKPLRVAPGGLREGVCIESAAA